MSKHELGKKRIKEILGEGSEQAIISLLESISPDFSNYIVEFGYGDIYARAGFSDKSRELAAVTALIARGNTGTPLKVHLGGMLNVGWKKEEIIELIIFLTAYIGFPSCVDAILTFKQLLDER